MPSEPGGSSDPPPPPTTSAKSETHPVPEDDAKSTKDQILQGTDIIQPSVPDGGYGWVIVLASFLCNFIVDGITSTFGVFLPFYTEQFQTTPGVTSWAGSVLCAVTFCFGPIVSAATNKFGCRVVLITGAFVASLGFGLSYFVKTFPLLILTYGFIGGVGFGMIFLPSIVCVGYYFERRRSIATGIAVCGSGVGMICFPPMAAKLLATFHWSVVNAIYAGIILLCAALGLLMRPLVVQVVLADDEDEDWDEADDHLKQQRELTSDIDAAVGGGHSGGTRRDSVVSGRSVSTKGSKSSRKARLGSGTGSQFNYMGRTYSYKAVPLAFRKSHTPTSVLASAITSAGRKSALSMGGSKARLSTASGEGQDLSSVLASSSAEEDLVSGEDDRPDKPKIVRPLARKDIFYTGTLDKIQDFSETRRSLSTGRRSLESRKDEEVSKLPEAPAPPSKCPCCRRCRLLRTEGIISAFPFLSTLTKMLDCSLLKNPVFLFIAITNFIAMLAFYIPPTYLVNAAKEKKISATDAPILLSVIGATNTIGRVLVGFLAGLPHIKAIRMYSACIFVAGVSLCCVPLCSAYWSFIVTAATFGLFISGFVALVSIVLVDMLGLDKLTTAFGLLLLFWSGASLIGPPMAGSLYDKFKSYDIPFYVAGGLFLTAALISALVPWVKTWHDKRNMTKVEDKEALIYHVSYLEDDKKKEDGGDSGNPSVTSNVPEKG